MKSEQPKRIRKTVYVIGAGFSAGLGYPVTKSLLVEVWNRLPKASQEQLRKIIEFHHPAFRLERSTSFPDIEQLLTEMVVNDQMLTASRPAIGRFTREKLENTRQALLVSIAEWFHEIHESAVKKDWLKKIVAKFKRENAAIISFNWDLILDDLLLNMDVSDRSYGIGNDLESGPLLLKPHGSLNWYGGRQLRHVPKSKVTTIYDHNDEDQCVHAFRRPRKIKSKSGKHYNPLIIPPTHFKDFTPQIFQRLWNTCTEVLSTPERLIFLGYSLPTADLQAQFIFRCGFYNQTHGRIKDADSRRPATGPAEVIIVNPDQDAAKRIESVAGPTIQCTWIPKNIEDWLGEGNR